MFALGGKVERRWGKLADWSFSTAQTRLEIITSPALVCNTNSEVTWVGFYDFWHILNGKSFFEQPDYIKTNEVHHFSHYHPFSTAPRCSTATSSLDCGMCSIRSWTKRVVGSGGWATSVLSPSFAPPKRPSCARMATTKRSPPWKLTWHWKIPIFSGKYIVKCWIFHCHVSFRGGNPLWKGSGWWVRLF